MEQNTDTGPKAKRKDTIMELIIDTADLDAIKELDAFLTIAGVTTNPTIITKSGKSPEQAIGDIIDYLAPDQKLFVQAVSTDFDGIVAEARRVAGLRDKNSYVKIPVTREGLRAIKAVHAEGIGVLATAIYSPEEAFLAAMNGADYLAPYVNRMCNYGDGVEAVCDLIDMLAVQGMDAKVLAASFKNVDQVHKLILAGIPAMTVGPDVIRAMVDHPGTEIAVNEFTQNWKAAYGRETLFA